MKLIFFTALLLLLTGTLDAEENRNGEQTRKPLRIEIALGYPSFGLAVEYILPFLLNSRSIGVGGIIGYYPGIIMTDIEDTPENPYSTKETTKYKKPFNAGIRINHYLSKNQTGTGFYISLGWNYIRIEAANLTKEYCEGILCERIWTANASIHAFSLKIGYRTIIWNNVTFSAECGYLFEIMFDPDVSWEIGQNKLEEKRYLKKKYLSDFGAGISAGIAF